MRIYKIFGIIAVISINNIQASCWCCYEEEIIQGRIIDSLGIYYLTDDSLTISKKDSILLGRHWLVEIFILRNKWQELIDLYYENTRVEIHPHDCGKELREYVNRNYNYQNILRSISKLPKEKQAILFLIIKHREIEKRKSNLSDADLFRNLSELRDSSKSALKSNHSIKSNHIISSHFTHIWKPLDWYSGLFGVSASFNQPLMYWSSKIYPSIGLGFYLGFSTIFGDLFIKDELTFLHYAHSEGSVGEFDWYEKDFINSLDGALIFKPHLPFGINHRFSSEFGIGFMSYHLSKDLLISSADNYFIPYVLISVRIEKNLSSVEDKVFNPEGYFIWYHGFGVTIKSGSFFNHEDDLTISIDWRWAVTGLYFRKNG